MAPEGRKVGSLKRRVRSHLAGWEMKNCTLLWRERRFEVKMHKTPCSEHFRKLRYEKNVARSTFSSQNGQSTPFSEHLWKLRWWKSARRSSAKHIWKSKVWKTDGLGPLLEALCHKWAKCGGFVAVSKTLAGVGYLKGTRKDACQVAGPVRETWSAEMLGGPGRWFPERCCLFGALDIQVC